MSVQHRQIQIFWIRGWLWSSIETMPTSCCQLFTKTIWQWAVSLGNLPNFTLQSLFWSAFHNPFYNVIGDKIQTWKIRNALIPRVKQTKITAMTHLTWRQFCCILFQHPIDNFPILNDLTFFLHRFGYSRVRIFGCGWAITRHSWPL